MKNRLLLSLAALVATTAFSAAAADLASRKAFATFAAPAPTWAGFYAGLNAGGTWSSNNSAQITTWPLANGEGLIYWATLNGKVENSSTDGFIGGGQIGYNWQVPIGNAEFVTGVEVDIQGIAANGGGKTTNAVWQSQPLGCCNVWNSTAISTNLQWIGTVRGRLGYLVTPALLIYGTGGLAYGGLNFSFRQTQLDSFVFPSNFGACPGFPGYSCNGPTPIAIGIGSTGYSGTMVGYTVGGGAEWMLLSNWSLRAEYVYYNLGSAAATAFPVNYPLSYVAASGARPGPPYAASTAQASIVGNIVRVGVNYHFNWGAATNVAKF